MNNWSDIENCINNICYKSESLKKNIDIINNSLNTESLIKLKQNITNVEQIITRLNDITGSLTNALTNMNAKLNIGINNNAKWVNKLVVNLDINNNQLISGPMSPNDKTETAINFYGYKFHLNVYTDTWDIPLYEHAIYRKDDTDYIVYKFDENVLFVCDKFTIKGANASGTKNCRNKVCKFRENCKFYHDPLEEDVISNNTNIQNFPHNQLMSDINFGDYNLFTEQIAKLSRDEVATFARYISNMLLVLKAFYGQVH